MNSASSGSSGSETDDDSMVAFERTFESISSHPTRDSAQNAIALLPFGSHFMYQYAFVRSKGHQTSGYRNTLHLKCEKYVRIAEVIDLKSSFVLEEAGEHKGISTGRAVDGIRLFLKREADTMLLGGAGPKKCLQLLLARHEKDADVMGQLPTEGQLKNSKAYLKKSTAGRWEISTPVALKDWFSARMCDSSDVFFLGSSFDDTNDGDTFLSYCEQQKSELLHLFKDDNGARATSFGLIVTSRCMFRNVLKYQVAQGSQPLGPLTAHTNFTSRLLRTAVRLAEQYCFVHLNLAFGSLDHASYITNAYENCLQHLDCWPHLARKARERVCNDQSAKVYDATVLPLLRNLHESRSRDQIYALSKVIIKFMSENGGANCAE
ncbi:hypothetical protein GN958_ATG08836 [Phytophthora infestans]|uniref:MULE transposase domain-containing protein n=1 Tax=Phytophthora infestans TaxID=4787 RepID=A0A8S9UQV6_PHYIN|nr:hypothetical protein GN958_ATG08836 [Phytophthora infestans]